MDSNFIKPRYDAGGFAALPGRVTEALSSGRYDAVVLLLIDGFGWRFFEKFQGEPFLQAVKREGTITRLTSQFPSTTAAHLTTIHTGMPVGQHGIYEWYYYEPLVDAVIAPLLYSFSGTAQRDTLKPAGVKPARLFPATNLYRLLKKQGVAATIFQHREYTPSTYSDAVFHAARSEGYKTLSEALVNLAGSLPGAKAPEYFFLYFDRVDSISHEYGPGSAQTEAEVLTFLMTMEQIFLKALKGNRRKVLFLLTADHGQVEVDPNTTIFLNRGTAFAGIERFIKTDRAGALIVPAGSARDFFLYIKPGLLAEAHSFLASRLAGRAEVRKVSEMMEQGYFGPELSDVFRGRAGDLVILPFAGESVWWYEKDRFEQRFYGHHGGLTKQEMEIPLLMWEMM